MYQFVQMLRAANKMVLVVLHALISLKQFVMLQRIALTLVEIVFDVTTFHKYNAVPKCNVNMI